MRKSIDIAVTKQTKLIELNSKIEDFEKARKPFDEKLDKIEDRLDINLIKYTNISTRNSNPELSYKKTLLLNPSVDNINKRSNSTNSRDILII